MRLDHLLSKEKKGKFTVSIQLLRAGEGACSSAWLEHCADNAGVKGSSPFRPTEHGDVAQLGEHRLCKAGARGSSPLISTRERPEGHRREQESKVDG